jgi:hypothetical protein
MALCFALLAGMYAIGIWSDGVNLTLGSLFWLG